MKEAIDVAGRSLLDHAAAAQEDRRLLRRAVSCRDRCVPDGPGFGAEPKVAQRKETFIWEGLPGPVCEVLKRAPLECKGLLGRHGQLEQVPEH